MTNHVKCWKFFTRKRYVFRSIFVTIDGVFSVDECTTSWSFMIRSFSLDKTSARRYFFPLKVVLLLYLVNQVSIWFFNRICSFSYLESVVNRFKVRNSYKSKSNVTFLYIYENNLFDYNFIFKVDLFIKKFTHFYFD